MSLMPGIAEFLPNPNYGYPYIGSPRRIKPTALLAVHITGNSALPSARSEVIYASRAGSGASFTFANNRNGTAVQSMHPEVAVPWTNGDMQSPDLSNPVIAAIARQNAYNPNEYFAGTCENVGYEPGNPLTDAQVEACAKQAAWLHGIFPYLPIDTVRVIGHRRINDVTRHNCPTSGDLAALEARIVARANALIGAPTPPAPGGDVSQGHPQTYIAKSGRVLLAGGQTPYNAFQYLGQNADGTPNLKRYANLTWTSATNASVIARVHWEANKAEADCFLLSPWVYLPGAGWVEMLWWSKSPLPEPAFTPDAGADCTAAVNTAVAPLQARLAAVRKALG